MAFVFLVVIPEGDLRLSLFLLLHFLLSSPKGICCCTCREPIMPLSLFSLMT